MVGLNKFTYFRSSVSSTENDINTWLVKAWRAIDRLSFIGRSDLSDKKERRFTSSGRVNAAIWILLYSHNHNNTINKQTSEDFLRKICTSHLIARVRKGLLKVCVWEGAGDQTELQYFDPHSYGRHRCVFLVLQGCSTGGPEAHSAGWWLSLLHLISNFSGPQLNRGPRAPSAWRGFPYHISSITPTQTLTATLSWLSYIIVQRPLSRPLDLWNRMFDRH